MASYSGTPSSRSKVTKVKPILKKFTQSEKTSLDLDRPAGEQGFGNYASEIANGNRSVHDVSFTSTRRGYHARSTSGASQFSTATTGSGHRNGSFVHPFQQTPRPYTPPLAKTYQGSLNGGAYSRDSEGVDEEDEYPRNLNVRSPSNLSSRTASYTNSTGANLPPLQIPTKSNSSSRLGIGGSTSNLHSTLSVVSVDLTSPADTVSPISGVRTSMDKGFRMRSHSHVESGARYETVQEARKAWQEREQAKADKLAQEEARAAEKRQRRLERSGRKSDSSGGARSKRSKSDATIIQEKPDGFYAHDYNTTAPNLRAPHTDESFTPPQRSKTGLSTKKKTHSTWTSFIIWFRTRLLRMKKH